jgi:hypothetical protein
MISTGSLLNIHKNAQYRQAACPGPEVLGIFSPVEGNVALSASFTNAGERFLHVGAK